MLTPPTFLAPLLARPVAVLGVGVSGQALSTLLHALGTTCRLYDAHPRGEASALFTATEAEAVSLVLFSPGFPPNHPWLSLARTCGARCLSELDFASLLWRGRLLAITGTNGKTTTTEFLAHALRHAGHEAHAVGNIGFPLAQLVHDLAGGAPETIAVCEVSSFQAETLRHFRPDAVLWTNFAEDHLERHGDLPSYFAAKWRLLERCIGGHVLVGADVARQAALYGESLPPDAIVHPDPEPTGDLLLQGTPFANFPLRENFLLVAAWWRAEGLRESSLYAAAHTFQLGPHRLQHLGHFADLHWWDDSKATNFHAVEAALRRFAKPVLLLAGGKSKGGDVEGFVARITPRVRHAAFFGETRHALAAAATACGLAHAVLPDLAAAVAHLQALALPGEDLVLSPGFSSLDQFSSYAARGTAFANLARAASSPLSVPTQPS